MIKNEIVLKALHKAGWDLERKINIKDIILLLNSEGYPEIDCVKKFLERFGGLTIHFKNIQNGEPNDDINFDVEHATHIENVERITEDYMPRVGKKMSLIGTAYRDNFCLMMAEDKSVYGGYSDFLCKISDTGEGAIESIILNYDFVTIK